MALSNFSVGDYVEIKERPNSWSSFLSSSCPSSLEYPQKFQIKEIKEVRQETKWCDHIAMKMQSLEDEKSYGFDLDCLIKENNIAKVCGSSTKPAGEAKITSMLKTLSATLKRVLSADMQSQFKADLRNGELALTEKGKNELMEILAEKYSKELTDRANEIIAEVEKISDK